MKILVVRNDKLGDFLTALPALHQLKKHCPESKLSVLISPMNETIARHCDFIDEVIIDRQQGIFQLARELKKHHFDLSITLFSNTRVAISQFLAGIPKRVAPATKLAQVFYSRRVIQRRSQVKMSEFEYNLQLVQAVFHGLPAYKPQPLLSFSDNEIELKFREFSTKMETTGKVVAFHPGFGGSSDANWNVAEYIELARSLETRGDLNIIFTFGPGDEAFVQEYERLKGPLNAKTYISRDSVAEFGKLIASFDLFVSTSTGTFHLASAVGTKTMTFFADSLFASSKRWKGIGDESLQHNYMIPKDAEKRTELFSQVKTDLQKLV